MEVTINTMTLGSDICMLCIGVPGFLMLRLALLWTDRRLYFSIYYRYLLSLFPLFTSRFLVIYFHFWTTIFLSILHQFLLCMGYKSFIVLELALINRKNKHYSCKTLRFHLFSNFSLYWYQSQSDPFYGA